MECQCHHCIVGQTSLVNMGTSCCNVQMFLADTSSHHFNFGCAHPRRISCKFDLCLVLDANQVLLTRLELSFLLHPSATSHRTHHPKQESATNMSNKCSCTRQLGSYDPKVTELGPRAVRALGCFEHPQLLRQPQLESYLNLTTI